MRFKFILPSLTEADSPFWRPIKYSLFPPLGLATLAGYLAEDDEAEIVDQHVQALDLDDTPDVVAIEVYITNAYRAYRIADHYRSKGVMVILGGLHVTALPEEAAAHADAIFLGPAEESFPRFLQDLRHSCVARRYVSSARTLRSVPPIRRDLIDRRLYLVPNSIVVTRGCPHHCSFCYKDAFYQGGKSFYVQQVDECVFRSNSDSDSDSFRTLNPVQIGHRFRCKPDSDSDFKSDRFPAVPEWCPKWIGLFTRGAGATVDKSAGSDLFHNEKGTPMARQPKSMRQIKEILRLKHEVQLSVRDISRSCGIPASTVGDYIKRAQAAGLTWPLPEECSEEALLERLLGAADPAPVLAAAMLPDWTRIHEELRREGVTLRLLWQEYRQAHPTGYGYSRFCELYARWAGTLDPVLRQVHPPGEKMFVDWAGQTVPIYSSLDGSVSSASIFVAVLGASNKIYAEAFPNQQLPSWIAGHCHAYNFFGGVTKVTVPDNPKTAVIEACRYEPRIHASYQEMAMHYGTVIIPARPRKPRDKAKVEGGVLIASRSILATLRDQKFFHIKALNVALYAGAVQLNGQPFQKLEGSRDSWFERYEKAVLLPLPQHPYELATWQKATVNIDYHVAVQKHYYSAPYSLIHAELDVRLTETTVELFHKSRRVAAHVRSSQPGQFTTIEEHRPKAHQKYLQWTPSRLLAWAGKVGPHCSKLVDHIMKSRPHPEMGYRSVMGIMRLGKGVGDLRLEAACRRALHFGVCTYKSIQSILDNQLDQQPWEQELPFHNSPHENIRGKDYYNPAVQPTP